MAAFCNLVVDILTNFEFLWLFYAAYGCCHFSIVMHQAFESLYVWRSKLASHSTFNYYHWQRGQHQLITTLVLQIFRYQLIEVLFIRVHCCIIAFYNLIFLNSNNTALEITRDGSKHSNFFFLGGGVEAKLFVYFETMTIFISKLYNKFCWAMQSYSRVKLLGQFIRGAKCSCWECGG